MKSADKAKVQQQMCELARTLKEELQKNNVDAMGELLHESWMLKKSMASGISNQLIDETYEKAINAGEMCIRDSLTAFLKTFFFKHQFLFPCIH